MRQALLLGTADKQIVEREEDYTKVIQIIIKREEGKGGCIFIGQVFQKVMNVSVKK